MRVKNFQRFVESVDYRMSIINRISYLKCDGGKSFIVDAGPKLDPGLNMKSDIDKIIGEMSISKDRNDMYQLPLSILAKTGKYTDIKYVNGRWESNSLKNISLVVDENGEWHPVNKLNTNYSDLSELLYDILDKLGLIGDIERLTPIKLKQWLLDFKSKNDIYELIKTHIGDDIKSYTKANRDRSLIGEAAENKVAESLKLKGMEILYQGGDGDSIDMIYGSDLIVGKDNKVYLVQVKSQDFAAKNAFTKSRYRRTNYSKVDWFCAPFKDGIIIYTDRYPEGRIV